MVRHQALGVRRHECINFELDDELTATARKYAGTHPSCLKCRQGAIGAFRVPKKKLAIGQLFLTLTRRLAVIFAQSERWY